MSGLITFCKSPSCGTVFIMNNIIGGRGRVTLNIENAGPCPKCGEYGKIPDGEYEIGSAIARLVNGSKESVENLNKIYQLLDSFKAKIEETKKEEIIETVEKLSPKIADLIRNAPSSSLFGWLNFVMTIISFYIMIIDRLDKHEKLQENKTQEMFIEYLIKENQKINREKDSLVANFNTTRQTKVGRNEKCFCGSDKKYKNCCGRFN